MADELRVSVLRLVYRLYYSTLSRVVQDDRGCVAVFTALAPTVLIDVGHWQMVQRNMPGAARYTPVHEVDYSGSATANSGCTQIVADTINFSGSANFQHSCSGVGASNPGGNPKMAE